MKRQRSILSSLALAYCLAWAAPATAGLGQEQASEALPATYADGARRWTVADSASLRFLSRPGDPLEADGIAPRISGAPVLWSPDRRRFLLLTYQGDVACDCLRYTLGVYDADQLIRALRAGRGTPDAPRPLAETVMETSLPYLWMAGISGPRWADSETVQFIGLRDGQRQLFRLSVGSGEVEQVTRVSVPFGERAIDPVGAGGVEDYEIRAGTSLFTVAQDAERPALSQAYPSISIASEPLLNYYYRRTSILRMYLSGAAGGNERLAATCIAGGAAGFSLSPDGRWAVFGCSRIADPAGDAPPTARDLDAAQPAAFWLMNTSTGRVDRIAGASRGGRDRIVWRGDGARVALLGAEIPGSCPGAAQGEHVVAILDPSNGGLSCVAPVQGQSNGATSRVTGVRWEGGNDLILTYLARGTPARRFERVFAQAGNDWRGGPEQESRTASDTQPRAPGGLEVTLREGPNQPWSIIASLGGREMALTRPDPALQGIARAPVREISWREGEFAIHGGLVMPRDHRPGTRLPLVIQLGHYFPDRFLPDGSASTAFAAQALAAQGMAVLNIDFLPQPGQRGARRNEDIVRERIDAIVASLSGQGLIDPERVGLVGFSHSGFQTHYLASHPGRTRLAAAVAADSWTASYGEYVIYDGAVANSPNIARMISDYWGGTFWEDRAAWLEHAPLFNAHNVVAPILFESHRGAGVAFAAAEEIGAYRLLNKPFEFFLFPTGEHQLRLPRQRMASMGNSVSWMAFWLQGREITGLQTEETYARWRRMRQQRDAQAGSPVTPAQ